MPLSVTELITDGTRAFDATNQPVVYTLLPFVQTPNKEVRAQKIDAGPNTVTIQTDPATTDTFPGGATQIVLTDNVINYFSLIKKPGVSGIPAIILAGVGSSGGGATPQGPPSVTAVTPPIITVDPAGNAVLLLDVIYPVALGSMTAIYVQIQAPFPGPTDDTATNLPAAATPIVQGPFALNIVDGVVTNTQVYITVPAPTADQTWSLEVATASNFITNPFIGSGPGFETFGIGPGSGPPGAEWAPNPLPPLGLTVEREIRNGAEQWWRPNLTWTDPTADPGYLNVAVWDVGLLDPGIDATDPEQQIISLGTLAATAISKTTSNPPATGEFHRPGVGRAPIVTQSSATQSFQAQWMRVGDEAVNYILMVRPVTADGEQNSYVPGVTTAIDCPIGPEVILEDVTDFSVSFGGPDGAAYGTADYDGKLALLMVPNFTPPAGNPPWAWIEWWWTNQAGAWQVLGDPSTPGVAGLAEISNLPTASFIANFLAVSKDANGQDRNGNASTDPTNPPDGTPTFSLAIPVYNATPTAGVEYAGLVTITSITVAPGGYTAPDGTYQQLVTVVIVPPAGDTRWGSWDLVYKDLSGNRITWASMIRADTYQFIWKPPAGAVAGTWYVVSRDVTGRINTLVPGTTPSVSGTYGSTSQLDFSAAKLATLNQNLLRINPATGLFEPYDVAQAIFGALQIGGGTANGTCSTANSGANTNVTGLTGTFASTMVGNTIYINGVPVTVLTFVNSAAIVVSTNLGTLTGVNWSYGRSPQFKIFDRSNTQIGFWGDDSYNTGFVGLFGGADIRLGGTIGSPCFEVDSAGLITISGTTTAVKIQGAKITVQSSSGPASKTVTIDPAGFSNPISVVNSAGASVTVDAIEIIVSNAGGQSASLQPDTLVFNDFSISSGTIDLYNSQFTAGQGVVPIVATVKALNQAAAIATANLRYTATSSALPAGLYRVSAYLVCSTSGTGGLATLTIGWNDGIAARSAASNVSLTSTSNSPTFSVDVLVADGVHDITYAVAFTGTGAAAYNVYLTLERLT